MNPIEKQRKQLIFRSWHRGTKEMDLLLGTFADEHLPGFGADELSEYAQILEVNDPDLYNWMTGKEDPPANMTGPVFARLKEHTYAKSA